MLTRTPLYEAHLALKAKMVDFHGYEMPLHYGSQIEEHHHVRNDAGLFDVSHMTILDILGAGGRQFLRKLLTHDVDTLTHKGKALYTCMCNENGGIIDDLIVYQLSPDHYRLVLNSATRKRDLSWIAQKSQGFSVGLMERNDLGIIAIQGPNAIEKTKTILPPTAVDAITTLEPFESVQVDDLFFARTGYTGEEGLEVLLPQEKLGSFWQSLLDANIHPCGLASRDTLRLEAGLLLYGQDMDEQTSPLESGLGWVVKWTPEDRDFIGMGALLSQKQKGISRQLVGLLLEDKAIMRHGQKIMAQNQEIGVITSGGFSPTLNRSIALARVHTPIPTEVFVEIRGKLFKAQITKPRFVKKGQSLLDNIHL